MGVTNKLVRTDDGASVGCLAVNEAVALFRDKWTLLCLGALSKADGPLRYHALQAAVGGISQRMLTLTLKNLERNGLVTRTLFASVPPRVDYALTPIGRSLGAPMKALLHWSLENHEAMERARRAYV